MSTYKNASRVVPVLVLVVLVVGSLACGESTPTGEPEVSEATSEAPEKQAPPEEATSTPEVAAAPTDTPEPTAAPTDTAQPTAAPTDTAQPPAAPTDTPERQARYLGDVLEQSGYLLCALAVEDPATKPGLFYEAEAGKKLVGVEFIVGNVSGEMISSNELRATLVDSEGFACGAEGGAVDDSMQLLDVSPGEKVRGWAGFIVPQDSTPATLKYEMNGGPTLQVGLAKPEGVVEEPKFVYAPDPGLPRLGEVAEGSGYSLSALAVEDPASRPGLFYEAEAGKKVVGVEFIVGNVSGEMITSNELRATLVDSEGFAYGAEGGAVEDSMQLLDVSPGEKVRGWAGFIVPEDLTPATLKYEMNGGPTLQVRLIAE